MASPGSSSVEGKKEKGKYTFRVIVIMGWIRAYLMMIVPFTSHTKVRGGETNLHGIKCAMAAGM